jgi:hypothetical protein
MGLVNAADEAQARAAALADPAISTRRATIQLGRIATAFFHD